MYQASSSLANSKIIGIMFRIIRVFMTTSHMTCAATLYMKSWMALSGGGITSSALVFFNLSSLSF